MKKNSFIFSFLSLVFFFLPILFFTFSSCKKGPGQGGRAAIKGKVWVRKHDLAYTAVLDNYAGADEDVYLIYGDETGYGERTKTDYQGDFEFRYLRKGKYTVYVYSDDSVKIVTLKNSSFKAAIVQEINITERKQEFDTGTITILE